MNLIIRLSILVLMLPLLSAYAFDEANKTVSRLGVQSTQFYFDAKEGFGASCLWGVIYTDHSTSFGKAAFAQIAAAKHAGKPLSRIVYDVDKSGFCQLSLVEVN